MKAFNIRIDNMEVRSCHDDPTILAEILLHTEDNPYLLAEWKANGDVHNLSTIPCKFKEEDNFNPKLFINMIKVLTTIISHLYLGDNEALHVKDGEGEGFMRELGEDLTEGDEDEGEEEETD